MGLAEGFDSKRVNINGIVWDATPRLDGNNVVITVKFSTSRLAESAAATMGLLPKLETNEQRLQRELDEARAEIARLTVKEWEPGKFYTKGERVMHDGKLMEVRSWCGNTGGYNDHLWKNHKFCWKEVVMEIGGEG